MCVVSMVYDKFGPQFPQPWDVRPGWPHPVTPETGPITDIPNAPADLLGLQKLIDDFRKATEAARVVDKLTGQPDCADPDKAKLEERVAKLEAAIAALKKATAPKKRKAAKRRRR